MGEREEGGGGPTTLQHREGKEARGEGGAPPPAALMSEPESSSDRAGEGGAKGGVITKGEGAERRDWDDDGNGDCCWERGVASRIGKRCVDDEDGTAEERTMPTARGETRTGAWEAEEPFEHDKGFGGERFARNDGLSTRCE